MKALLKLSTLLGSQAWSSCDFPSVGGKKNNKPIPPRIDAVCLLNHCVMFLL